jgi:hypothetical protein
LGLAVDFGVISSSHIISDAAIDRVIAIRTACHVMTTDQVVIPYITKEMIITLLT